MMGPTNGKGGFKEFAQHEKTAADKAIPPGVSEAVKPAPIVETPAPKLDSAPAVRAHKILLNTQQDTSPTARH